MARLTAVEMASVWDAHLEYKTETQTGPSMALMSGASSGLVQAMMKVAAWDLQMVEDSGQCLVSTRAVATAAASDSQKKGALLDSARAEAKALVTGLKKE